MTTALDMIPALNSRVLVRCESMQIEATVKNVKNSWGKPRLLVTPVSGSGEQWVQMDRVTVPATATYEQRKAEGRVIDCAEAQSRREAEAEGNAALAAFAERVQRTLNAEYAKTACSNPQSRS